MTRYKGYGRDSEYRNGRGGQGGTAEGVACHPRGSADNRGLCETADRGIRERRGMIYKNIEVLNVGFDPKTGQVAFMVGRVVR